MFDRKPQAGGEIPIINSAFWRPLSDHIYFQGGILLVLVPVSTLKTTSISDVVTSTSTVLVRLVILSDNSLWVIVHVLLLVTISTWDSLYQIHEVISIEVSSVD